MNKQLQRKRSKQVGSCYHIIMARNTRYRFSVLKNEKEMQFVMLMRLSDEETLKLGDWESFIVSLQIIWFVLC